MSGSLPSLSERITVAVTANEKARVDAAAAIAGLSTGPFVRLRLLGRGATAGRPAAPALAALLRTLARIEGCPIDPALAAELRRALVELRPFLVGSLA